MRLILLVLFFSLFLSKGITQNLYFPPLNGSNWDTTEPRSLNWCSSKIDSLYRFLDSNNTKAFMLLKNGKIVLEKYFGTHTQNTLWYWASAGKTLTSFVTGIAQQEHFLAITEPSSHYLGTGWTVCPPSKEDKITIRHQLTMTTGLDDEVQDPYCTLDTCLRYKADAGTRWAYHNAPYTQLDKVIETATGSTLNDYTTLKLKTPTGMTGMFYTVDYNHVFFSTARSMARFGLLILNKGNWNGNQVMTDTAYFRQMTHASQELNKGYGYLWWLNGSVSFMVPQSQIVFPGMMCPNAPADMIAALGKNGQLLNIVPSENLIWLRMGDAPENAEVPFLLNDQIWRYIKVFDCHANDIPETGNSEEKLLLDYRPDAGDIHIEANRQIKTVEIFDIAGRNRGVEKFYSKIIDFHIFLKPGIYLVRICYADGQLIIRKMMVHS